MLSGTGKIVLSSKGNTGIVYIPSNMITDSAFPLSPPVKIKITVDGNRVILESIPDKYVNP